MQLTLHRWFTLVEERLWSDARAAEPPLRKVAAIGVVRNPFAGRHGVEDLSQLIAGSVALGEFLIGKALAAMGSDGVVSYGKGGIVGLDGEQEHINAMVTADFAAPMRAAIGGGKAWVPSYTKRAAPGTTIDIPLAHKDALYVRSHYDGMTITLAEAPLPDEIAVMMCVANRGRVGARVGGLAAADVIGVDGLR